MNPLLTTATVIMTRNAGTHWLITLALAATVGDALELPAGNEITLRAPSGSPIPSEGSTVALRLEPRSGFAEPVVMGGGAGMPLVEFNAAEASKAEAMAELKRHFAESMDETRAFYEKALAEQKALLSDKATELTAALSELGAIRAQHAQSLWEYDLLLTANRHDLTDTDPPAANPLNTTLPPEPPPELCSTTPAPVDEPAQSTLTEADFPNGIPTAPTPAGDPIDLAAEGLPTEAEPPPHSDPLPIEQDPPDSIS